MMSKLSNRVKAQSEDIITKRPASLRCATSHVKTVIFITASANSMLVATLPSVI